MKATLSTIHNFKLQLHQIKNVFVSSLGQQSGEMFKELLLILPAHVMFPVLALFAYMLMVMMVMASGYTIRLPFLLGEISPPVAQQPQLHHQHAPQQQKRITVKEEKESIEQLPETRSEPVLLS